MIAQRLPLAGERQIDPAKPEPGDATPRVKRVVTRQRDAGEARGYPGECLVRAEVERGNRH